MKKGVLKQLSLVALICSIFPIVSYLLAIFQITLPGGIRTVLAGANLFCVLLGLGISIFCVKNNENRSIVNIASIIISIIWILMIVGFLVLALLL